MTTGEKIARLRKGNNLTQERLREMLDISRQTIYNWESGEATPTRENLQAIADKFGVPLSVLYENGEDKKIKPKNKTYSGDPKSGGRIYASAVLMFSLVVMTAYSIVIKDIKNEIESLENTVYNLNQQVEMLRKSVTDIKTARQPRENRYTYYDYKVLGYDYKTNMLTVRFSVTPVDYTDTTTARFTVDTSRGSYSAEAEFAGYQYTAEMDVYRQSDSPVYLYLTDGGKVRSFMIDILPDLTEDYKLGIAFSRLIGDKIMVKENGKLDYRNSRVDLSLIYTIDKANRQMDVYPVAAAVEIYADGQLIDTQDYTDSFKIDYRRHIENNMLREKDNILRGKYSTYLELNRKPLGEYTVVENPNICENSNLEFRLVITDNHGLNYSEKIHPLY